MNKLRHVIQRVKINNKHNMCSLSFHFGLQYLFVCVFPKPSYLWRCSRENHDTWYKVVHKYNYNFFNASLGFKMAAVQNIKSWIIYLINYKLKKNVYKKVWQLKNSKWCIIFTLIDWRINKKITLVKHGVAWLWKRPLKKEKL